MENLLTIIGAILASALTGVGIKLYSDWHERRRLRRQDESAIAIKQIEDKAAQRVEERAEVRELKLELKAAEDQCEEWRAKYYELRLSAMATDLKNVQCAERIAALEEENKRLKQP